MQLTMASLVKSKHSSERVIQTILDTIMGYAIEYFGLKKGLEPLLAM